MKRIIAVIVALVIALSFQPANATTPIDFQEIGLEFKTSTKDVTATVQALEYRGTKWGHTMAVIWAFDNYSRKNLQVKGTFSLHFAKGNPVALPTRYFNNVTVRARKTEHSSWTWEFAASRQPLYVQWNPTKTIVKPTTKALRWQVPKFDSAIAIWDPKPTPTPIPN